MLITIMLVALVAMILLGVPIAVALAGSSLLYIAMLGTIPEITVIHRMVNGVDSFPLLAVPFFIMAGNLMNSAGITKQIFDFAVAAVGWLKGGLGHVNVAGSVIFAGMSGTAVADAGGLGTIEIKAMRDHGYDVKLAVGITAASSTIGPIIPPSLPLVIYTFLDAFLPLLTPVIIIGGMSFGLFTPTEAAVFACAYALLLSVVLHRLMNLALVRTGRRARYSVLTLRQFVRVTMDTIETTAVVLFIVAAASIFGWVLTTSRTTEALGAWILSVADDPLTFLLLVNLFLLAVGCFMETIAAITILTPVLLPVAVKLGIDPVHFGIVMVLNLMIGLLTPPVGMVLYVLARVASISFEDCVRAVGPFLIPLFAVLALITFVPETVLWLPRLLKELGYI
jgi:TRAP-type C4-dicarboxylate transport system permease large subunit